MSLQCPLGKCQTPPIDTEAIKRDGWRDQGILVVHQDDTRLDWVQRESGVCCDITQIDASPVVSAILAAAESLLGDVAARMLRAVLPEIKTIDVLTPQSLAYDCMDESDFCLLWDGICGHLVARYWPQLTAEQVTEMADLMPHSEGI